MIPCLRTNSVLTNCKDDDDDYLGSTYEEPTKNAKACIPSSLELDTVKFWKTPPEEPGAKFCGDYIRGLNPQCDPEPVKEFRKKWLSLVALPSSSMCPKLTSDIEDCEMAHICR